MGYTIKLHTLPTHITGWQRRANIHPLGVTEHSTAGAPIDWKLVER